MPRSSLNSWPGKIDAVLAEQEWEWKMICYNQWLLFAKFNKIVTPKKIGSTLTPMTEIRDSGPSITQNYIYY